VLDENAALDQTAGKVCPSQVPIMARHIFNPAAVSASGGKSDGFAEDDFFFHPVVDPSKLGNLTRIIPSP
jgi:hypothetical protein